jgi:signal transduction histidine kinase
VAIAPGATVRREAASEVGDLRLWRAAVVAGLLLVLAYAAVPTRFVAFRELVLYTVTEVAAILAIVVGVRRFRPVAPQAWLLIAGGLTTFAIGDVLFGAYEVMGKDPFPSVADAFYLAGYPFLVAGLIVAIRRRGPRGDRRLMIDAAVVTVSVSLLAWVYIVEPAISSDLSSLETLVSAAYPLADIFVLAVAARFVMGSDWNVTALRLLVAGLFLTLVADFTYEGDVLSTVQNTRFVDTTLLLGIVVIGLAGLHPSMVALTEGPPERPGRVEGARLALIAWVCGVPPAVLVVQALRGEPLHVAAVIVSMVLLSILVVARFADITSRAYRTADREATLSRYASELLGASGREELFGLARTAARELVAGASADVVRHDPDRASNAHAFIAPIVVGGHVAADLVADGPDTDHSGVRHSLSTVATELSLALERERLLATHRAAAATLSQQNERLRELDRMKDQFVSTVSHELRTPLTSIVGYLELVLEGETGELNPEQRQFLEIVNRNCNRLNQLIDDILFVARVEAGRLELVKEWIDLPAVAAAAVESTRAVAERKGIDLRFFTPTDLPQLHADPTRLTQLLDNLLSNSVKFTSEGGAVTVTIEQYEGAASVAVADTGVGIPEDELGRLFERFFRASTASAAQGTGLGLSIVKTIAEAHGGTVSIASELGAGTSFTVKLPLDAKTDGAARPVSEEVTT